MKKLGVLLVVLLGLLTACASVPMASKEADAKAKRFAPAEDKVGIYLYRNDNLGAPFDMTVVIDGRVVGKTGPRTYFYWELPPGRHEVTSLTENTDTVVIDTETGKNYFVWQEFKIGMGLSKGQVHSKLHRVDAKTGMAGVRECKLAASN